MLNSTKRKILIGILIFSGVIIIGLFYINKQPAEDFEISHGWIVTSYCDVNEELYNGNKIEVFDFYGKLLGFYKNDFLKQVKIDGSGKGDGVQNSGMFLHYDYSVNDEKTYYLVNKSLGAYNNELISWTENKPSIAVNPAVPYGTKIRFKELGFESKANPKWVNEILKTKTFYADDKFFGYGDEKRIDVYTGLQKSKEFGAESLLIHNVTIYIEYS